MLSWHCKQALPEVVVIIGGFGLSISSVTPTLFINNNFSTKKPMNPGS
jgi:hypothetical protein